MALESAAGTGLEALDLVLVRAKADKGWVESPHRALAEAKKPKAHCELAIVQAVEKLVKAVGRTQVGRAMAPRIRDRPSEEDIDLGDAPGRLANSSRPSTINHYQWMTTATSRVEVRLCYSAHYLYVCFEVEEKRVRARHTRFQDPVYKDSCVEFFVDPFPDHGLGYLNFETNAAGALLAAFGTGKTRAKRLSPEDLAGFRIVASIHGPIDGDAHGADLDGPVTGSP